MRWPRRTPAVPDDVRSSLGLGDRERVLAHGRTRGGGWLVATDQGLVTDAWRVAWSEATHAQWYDEDERLAVTAVTEDGEVVERDVVVEEPGRVPETVHERVVATILLSRRVVVRGRGALRVVARRQPGADEVVWQVVPDAGVDATDPEVVERTRAAMAAMSDELGLR